MSFELSFLRQSYICAPALSAGQVDGIKFRSGPFPPDRNFLPFPPQISRGYISQCEQSVANRSASVKTFGSAAMNRDAFRRCIRTRYKGNWVARSTLQLLDPFYRPPVSLILKYISKCSLSKNDIWKKWNKKKVSRNFVIISFPIDICVRALRAVAKNDGAWMSMQLTNADLFIFGTLDGDMIPVWWAVLTNAGWRGIG